VLAANIRACNQFRAGGPPAALHSLGSLPRELLAPPAEGGSAPLAVSQQQHNQQGVALIRHNAVVFSDGQGGLQASGVGG